MQYCFFLTGLYNQQNIITYRPDENKERSTNYRRDDTTVVFAYKCRPIKATDAKWHGQPSCDRPFSLTSTDTYYYYHNITLHTHASLYSVMHGCWYNVLIYNSVTLKHRYAQFRDTYQYLTIFNVRNVIKTVVTSTH